MTKHFNKISTIGILVGLSIFMLTGCSSNQAEPEVDPVRNQASEALYKDMAIKYKQLFRQNLELRNMLLKAEEQRAADNEAFKTEISHLLNTIKLLEINIKQMNSRLKANAAKISQLSKTGETIPGMGEIPEDPGPSVFSQEKLPVTGVEGEFQTPAGSKAIKTVPIITGAEAVSPDLPGKSAKSPATVEDSKAVETPDSVFLVSGSKDQWQDPDLKPPTSPILLKVIPGAKKAYQKAFKAYSARDFENAIKLFSEFIGRFPSDSDADNSQYWIGQTYFQLQDYIKAESAFRKILKNYEHKETKHGYKTPDAILMLGRIYSLRDKPIKGRYYYQEVINRFPTSRSAAKAKREIQSMSVF